MSQLGGVKFRLFERRWLMDLGCASARLGLNFVFIHLSGARLALSILAGASFVRIPVAAAAVRARQYAGTITKWPDCDGRKLAGGCGGGEGWARVAGTGTGDPAGRQLCAAQQQPGSPPPRNLGRADRKWRLIGPAGTR